MVSDPPCYADAVPHRLDPLLTRPELTRRDLARFLRAEARGLETLVSLAVTELRAGSPTRAAQALEQAGAETADLRGWLERAAGQGIELPAVSRRVVELERSIAELRQPLAG